MRTWSDDFGVGPWQVYAYDETTIDATYCGITQPLPMLAALCSLSDTFRLELIQPLTEAGPYHDSLLAHGDADHLHHVRLAAADPAAAQAALETSGNDVVYDAAFAGADPTGPRLHARYYDTVPALGFLLEVVERPATFAMPEAVRSYPPITPAR